MKEKYRDDDKYKNVIPAQAGIQSAEGIPFRPGMTYEDMQYRIEQKRGHGNRNPFFLFSSLPRYFFLLATPIPRRPRPRSRRDIGSGTDALTYLSFASIVAQPGTAKFAS